MSKITGEGSFGYEDRFMYSKNFDGHILSVFSHEPFPEIKEIDISETAEIISIFNISDKKRNKIYFSLDDINAFKFMRIIDKDLYNKYHRYIKKKMY